MAGVTTARASAQGSHTAGKVRPVPCSLHPHNSAPDPTEVQRLQVQVQDKRQQPCSKGGQRVPTAQLAPSAAPLVTLPETYCAPAKKSTGFILGFILGFWFFFLPTLAGKSLPPECTAGTGDGHFNPKPTRPSESPAPRRSLGHLLSLSLTQWDRKFCPRQQPKLRRPKSP